MARLMGKILYLSYWCVVKLASANIVRTSRNLRRLAVSNDAPIWARIADLALKPTIARRVVNVNKIASNTKPSDIVAVPGKVLAVGGISHPVTIGALSISRAAVAKIKNAGGSIVSIEKLAELHPAGTGVILLG